MVHLWCVANKFLVSDSVDVSCCKSSGGGDTSADRGCLRFVLAWSIASFRELLVNDVQLKK